MFKSKIVTAGMAGMLAMSLGLAACGNNNASTPEADSTKTEATDTAKDASTILYWEGTLADNSTVAYMEDYENDEATIAITKEDLSGVKVWSGAVVTTDAGKSTITDKTSKETISFTVMDLTDTSVTLDIEGYGKAELKAITEEEYLAQAEELAGNSEVFYWKGTLADNSTVTYVEDIKNEEAGIAITKEDSSDVKVWSGAVVTTDAGESTITDKMSKETISYTLSDLTDTSVTIDIEGYGKAELKEITEDEFQAQEEGLANPAEEAAATTDAA